MNPKTQFIDIIVAKTWTAVELAQKLSGVPQEAFESIMVHLAAPSPAALENDAANSARDIQEKRNEQTKKLLKQAKDSFQDQVVIGSFSNVPRSLQDCVHSAESLVESLAKSHCEGLRTRFQLGQILDKISKSAECTAPGGKKIYGLILKKLQINTHSAAESIRFYSFGTKWPKFLQTTLLWTPVKNKIAGVTAYFEANGNGTETDYLSPSFWAPLPEQLEETPALPLAQSPI